ncbi:enoyl-CoA hydratase/isomerase family protein [Aliiroseovarius sp. PrR006]|uniref:enoyl-CoA hydratase/isomerase family protein n=1 Tax=Aliiroseovarius sp. PrR006 TaxID=2706883 RepID=UPI0013D69F80|nr:enoyl-CoA hydratase/isomerase family protein [Aliiroseovarius sp. PrR006]NDW53884.1 enoyl-CoA hydratase/isomerase family protein [Aliiroseovarius sp. PrR006]
MSDRVSTDQVDLASGGSCFRIAMQAPRANALEPGFLADLHRCLDELEASGAQKALFTGGRNFSSGGDVGKFFEAAKRNNAEAYADQVVPVLQDLVMRMIELPVVFASEIRGAVTGGSAGIVFASDLVVAAPDAFVQPYYGVMGYAPDGGWTATLPELIGVGPVQGWLLANHRHATDALAQLGLVHAVDADPEARALALLDEVETGFALATKSMLWNDTRRSAVRAALDAETSAFRTLIGRQEVLSRMTQFLQSTG